MTNVSIRKGMPSTDLTKEEFRARYFQRFADPAFDAVRPELDRVVETAWDGYRQHRKAPKTQSAGSEFADPSYELSLDWLKARDAVRDAAARHANTALPSRVLLINASPRSEHTCPGEMSKTYRLLESAREVIAAEAAMQCEVLDLSRLASEYGKQIHPCKACFSTSPALCHWPCPCYPNHAMGQATTG